MRDSLYYPVLGDIDGNFQRLLNLVQAVLEPKRAEKIRNLILDLSHDFNRPDDTILLGMKRAPAAKGFHHAFEGGLIYHILEMWAIWETHFRTPALVETDYVSNDRILEGIIYHDLHKAYKTFRLVGTEPWVVEYADDLSDLMTTHTTKSIWLLMTCGIELDLEQYHALLWSEGGYSKIQPKWQSVLAKVLYLLDETSGNVVDRIRTATWFDPRQRAENRNR